MKLASIAATLTALDRIMRLFGIALLTILLASGVANAASNCDAAKNATDLKSLQDQYYQAAAQLVGATTDADKQRFKLQLLNVDKHMQELQAVIRACPAS
jgi:hypothetical protein